MTRTSSTIAGDRLCASPQLPQRYGLSVFLRKGYPTLGGRVSGVGSREPIVRGAHVRLVGWNELPNELSELVRQRAKEDPAVASRVVGRKWVSVLRPGRAGELSIHQHLDSVTFLDVPPRADLTVRESSESVSVYGDSLESGNASVSAGMVLLRLGQASRVRWFSDSIGTPGFLFVERIAVLAVDAVLEYHSALVAANAVRENIHVVLNEPGSTVRINSVFVGGRTDQFDLGVTAEHRAPYTTSDLRAKGVLTGKAQGVYRGLVRVEKHATKSDGYQRCDTLLLSKTAEVDPIPNLEIATNDVRCTHGVTVSHMNPEHLFYLQSRGLGEGAARDLLVEGFTGTMLRSYPDHRVEVLRRSIHDVLHHASA